MSTYQTPIVNNKPPQVSDLSIYCDIRYDTSDYAPIYIGLHLTNGGLTSSTDWKIIKFTYSGSAVTRIQVAYGSWDNRASLSW